MPDKIVMQGRVLSQKHPIEYRRTNTTSDRQYYPEHCSYKQLVFSLLQVWIRIFFRLGAFIHVIPRERWSVTHPDMFV